MTQKTLRFAMTLSPEVLCRACGLRRRRQHRYGLGRVRSNDRRGSWGAPVPASDHLALPLLNGIAAGGELCVASREGESPSYRRGSDSDHGRAPLVPLFPAQSAERSADRNVAPGWRQAYQHHQRAMVSEGDYRLKTAAHLRRALFSDSARTTIRKLFHAKQLKRFPDARLISRRVGYRYDRAPATWFCDSGLHATLLPPVWQIPRAKIPSPRKGWTCRWPAG